MEKSVEAVLLFPQVLALCDPPLDPTRKERLGGCVRHPEASKAGKGWLGGSATDGGRAEILVLIECAMLHNIDNETRCEDPGMGRGWADAGGDVPLLLRGI
ncbi:hypothetical protein SAY87_019725 [Trapa incisa]|uniref:Uncharacterized protein n=1 Tax=Trapa incisa TaxID=236973 RepID=A0AAN7K2R1_9MYRT|nr:hypothetical protein SAY87_019725 [Trapa incisa]